MSAQTSYTLRQPVGYAGQIYACDPDDIVSRLVETPTGIPFGTAVGRGTDPERQIVAGGENFVGITIRSLEKEGAPNTGAIQWDQTESAGVMRKGYIWVICPSGCVAGDPVKYTIGTGVIDAGEPEDETEASLDGAEWDTTAPAGQVGVVRITGTTITIGEEDLGG